MDQTSVILLAGGKGVRMGTSLPKQFLSLKEKPIVSYSLNLFCSLPSIHEVIVVCDPSFQHYFADYPVVFALPGIRRQDSLKNGLERVSSATQWVCIHDAARPLITIEMLFKLFLEGKKTGAATLGMPVKWTVKMTKEDNIVDKTLNREKVWEIQTPQFISKKLLQEGILFADTHNLTVTDDVSFAELLSHPVKLVAGSYTNLKITTPEDLTIAEKFLENEQI